LLSCLSFCCLLGWKDALEDTLGGNALNFFQLMSELSSLSSSVMLGPEIFLLCGLTSPKRGIHFGDYPQAGERVKGTTPLY